jgi:hypothetical protein
MVIGWVGGFVYCGDGVGEVVEAARRADVAMWRSRARSVYIIIIVRICVKPFGSAGGHAE